jgi:hypothetical protein
MQRIKSSLNIVGRIFGLVGKTTRQSKTVGPKAEVEREVNTTPNADGEPEQVL